MHIMIHNNKRVITPPATNNKMRVGAMQKFHLYSQPHDLSSGPSNPPINNINEQILIASIVKRYSTIGNKAAIQDRIQIFGYLSTFEASATPFAPHTSTLIRTCTT